MHCLGLSKYHQDLIYRLENRIGTFPDGVMTVRSVVSMLPVASIQNACVI